MFAALVPSLPAARAPHLPVWTRRRAAGARLGYAWRRRGVPAREPALDQTGESLNRALIHADAAVMAAVAAGDEAAFAELARRVAPAILRFARATLSVSPAEAEEVVQEALIRLWQQAPSWQPDARVSTWLHKVAYRLCIDRLRRQRPAVDIDAIEPVLADPAPLATEMLMRLEDANAVRAAVDALPERQRIAIVLCHFQGLSQAEAAAIMGIGEEAYESLLARGRRRLRTTLTEEGQT